MTDDIPIPPEVVNVIAEYFAFAEHGMPLRSLPEVVQLRLRNTATVALRAGLKAWKGMKLTPYWEHMTHKRRVEMILPLTENSNDKA